jgi:multicomponent Na+:H+ antiporter subunit B
MIVLDAVDVAMTEASVGAGISTVLALGALYLTKTEEAEPRYSAWLPLFVALGTGAMLIWGTWNLPAFGLADTALNTGMGLEYLRRDYAETHIPNVVTSVLASYRGYDTLGETTVIFTAGLGVLLLLRRFQRQR